MAVTATLASCWDHVPVCTLVSVWPPQGPLHQ
jgi:hypothetical protein